MGCCCSCRRTLKMRDNIRVVDINGYVQDFDYPVIVRQLTAKPRNRSNNNNSNNNNDPELFVSTAEKLLSSTGSKQLVPETQLHQGHVYFLLPFSILSELLTPMDYVGLVAKLNSVAKTAPKNSIYDFNNSINNNNNNSVSNNGNRVRNGNSVNGSTQKRRRYINGRKRPWKPILSTIRERSFNRRSESDLLQHSEDDEMELINII